MKETEQFRNDNMKMKINQTERNKRTNRSINNKTSKTFYKNLKTSIKTYNKLNMREENESKENKMKKKKDKTKQTTNKHPIKC